MHLECSGTIPKRVKATGVKDNLAGNIYVILVDITYSVRVINHFILYVGL